MINDLKYIKEKTSELESSIERLHKNSLKTYKTFKTINKPLLNYSIINSAEINIYELSTLKNSNLYFTCKIDFYLPSSQDVEFLFLADNICISKTSKNFTNGFNEIFFNKEFSTIATGNVLLKLRVKSLNEKQIEIKNINLCIYGLKEEETNTKYQTLKVHDNKVLLSFLDNEELYYLLTDTHQNYYNSQDFIFYTDAKSYSFSYDTTTNKLLVFYVNKNNELLLTNLDLLNIKVLDNYTNNVSSCFGNNKFLVCYIQKSKCKYIIIENNTVSEPTTLSQFSNLIDVHASYNKHNNKFYIILTDINKQNYLIESLDEKFNFAENIKANINFTIVINEVANEI